MALSNPPVNSNVNENWLFEFTADNDTCLEFHPEDGSGDNNGSYINLGNTFADISPIVNFTVEFWMKSDDVTSVDFPLVVKGGPDDDEVDNDSFVVKQVNNDIFLQYEYGSGSNVTITTNTFALSADTWTHVAVVRSAATDDIKVYINGALAETESASAIENDPTGATSSDVLFHIGANFAKTKFYDGELAHVRVWNVAREATDIAYYYQRIVDSSATGLIGYWKLDEGSGTTAYDSSTNNNNGTLATGDSDGVTNFPTWTVGGFDKYIHAFGISFKDTTVSSEFYHGSVLNKNITIRDSIDITNGTSNTGNISVTSANFDIHGTDFYKLLFNGTNNYHNKEIRVYAQFEGEDTLSSCQQIFSGRIVDMKLNQDQNITMQINSHRPWDKIEFPQTKHSTLSIYEPTVYGAYNYGTETVAPYGGLYPIPIINISQGSSTEDNVSGSSVSGEGSIDVIMPKSYSSGGNNYAHIHLDDYFLRVTEAYNSNVEAEATISDGGVNVLKTPMDYVANGYIIPKEGDNQFGVTMMTNAENAFSRASDGDYDLTNFAQATMDDAGDLAFIQFKSFNKLLDNSKSYIVKFRVKADPVGSHSGTMPYALEIFKNGSTITGNRVLNDTGQQLATTGDYGTEITKDITNSDAPTEFNSKWTASASGGGQSWSSHILKVWGVKVLAVIDLYNDERDLNTLQSMKYLYSGGDGLTASWDSGAIAHGHDAHRDLLQRFAGISSTDPDNWSSLNTDRAIDNWKVRYWQLEPTNLKQALDKIAYEFGFVAKFTPTGTLKYIHVKKSSELSATLNLTSQDIDKVNLSTTGLGNVITKMEISNQLHPAESSRYYSSSTLTNTASRAKYNLGDKEGIQTINLNMNVGTIPTSANADCNADFYSYYNNIIGDMKILVSCDVVNPMKGCQLETGDIITFTDMPVEMFGTDFSTSKYYMVIETKRSPGKVSITAREVG